MVFIFTVAMLGIASWMLWVSADAYIRASETLRKYEEKLGQPPIKFEKPAVGPYAKFADEMHPRKFTAPPQSLNRHGG